MKNVIDILLVEDNPGDVRLTREALNDSRIANRLSVVNDGQAAIDFLERSGKHPAAPVPDLILLDLNLPKLNGREVLQRIKAHALWKVIPVIALTTSSAEQDVWDCYAHHVNCYVTKPMSYAPFMDVMKSIEDFWLTIARLPHQKK